MKISISVPGRFHAFDMALQLQKKAMLKQMITSYPLIKAKNFGIATTNVKTIVSKEIIYRLFQKIAGYHADNIFINDWFDAIASQKINMESDIYIIWSGFALKTLKRIRKKNSGAKIIIERGSTHIAFQREILEKAYQGFPELNPALPSSAIVAKEMQEYDQADYIAVPTYFAKKTFTDRNIPDHKVLVAPYGVNISSFTIKDFKVEKKIEIFFAGSFSVRKGAKTFLDILEKTRNNPDFRFTIIGNIQRGLFSYLKPYIDEKKLLLIPHVPQHELPSHYHRGDVFLFPSFEEGMAMVILQAMSCGLTVIGTPNSGAGMVIQDKENGFLVEPDDSGKILELLFMLQKNPDQLSRIGIKARQSVQNGFTWDDYGARIIQNYTRISNEYQD